MATAWGQWDSGHVFTFSDFMILLAMDGLEGKDPVCHCVTLGLGVLCVCACMRF